MVSLWETRRQFETFLAERLHPSLQDMGAGQPVVTFWEIEKVDRFK